MATRATTVAVNECEVVKRRRGIALGTM